MVEKANWFSRRYFVKVVAGGIAALSLPPGYLFLTQHLPAQVQTKPACAEAAVSCGTHQWALLIDQTKCVGCNECTWACKATNDFPSDSITWNVVYTERVTVGGAKEEVYLPRPCMQCENPPCVAACPVGATYKRASDGIVVIDYEKCIGCRYCMAACPYGARYFNWTTPTGKNWAVPQFGEPEVPRRPRGVVEKCTFCYQRLDSGLAKGLTPGVDPEATPACVDICPAGARFFGDIASGKVSSPKFGDRDVSTFINSATQLKSELNTKPRVYYITPGESQQ
ncbi:MAG: 4Fe-4S dicluster domain-containing protein [Conexivisphaerales archaeon]